MRDNTEQRFYEGDVITFRGNTYKVDRADTLPDGGVHQYRLTARDGPPATLIPKEDGSGEFAVKEFHAVEGGDITVIE